MDYSMLTVPLFYKRETIRNNTFAPVLFISTGVYRKTVKDFLHFN